MFRNITRLFLVYIFFISCKQNPTRVRNEDEGELANRESLYPFPQYIQGQIAYVDTVPLGIEMVTIKNGITLDSGFISREKFKELARTFQDPDPNKKDLRSQYIETSFHDLSLNTITFSINTKNPSLPLQQADILLNPETKTVKYLLLKKMENNDTSAITTTLMWVHNMNFQISTSAINNHGKETTSVIKVTWDKPIRRS